MDDARTIARAGDLAMRFARQTAKRVGITRAGGAWEARNDAGLSRYAAMRRVGNLTPIGLTSTGRERGSHDSSLLATPPVLRQGPSSDSDASTGGLPRDPNTLIPSESGRFVKQAGAELARPSRTRTLAGQVRPDLFRDVDARVNKISYAIAERSAGDELRSGVVDRTERQPDALASLSARSSATNREEDRSERAGERSAESELAPRALPVAGNGLAVSTLATARPLRTTTGARRASQTMAESGVGNTSGAVDSTERVAASPAMPFNKMNPAALRRNLLRTTGLGEMLAASLRTRLQPHLKFDPSIARIHRGAAAATAARELKAEAFTIGQDVFFGEGRYAPDTREGFGLLAHELAHVGQQAAQIGDRMRFFTATGGDEMEGEAQQAGASAVRADDLERRNRTGGALHQASAAPNAALAFALSSPRSRGGSPMPAQTATEESGAQGARVEPAASDARAVTDRVYELMKQEIALGRERGLSKRKGR